MTTFTEAWNTSFEGLPADTENVSLGATRIRALKVDIRQRMAVDHMWSDGLAVASNDGKHNQATLRPQAADPVLDSGDGALYTKAIAGNTELFWEDSAARVTQITLTGSLNFSGGLTIAGATNLQGNLIATGPIIEFGTLSFVNANNYRVAIESSVKTALAVANTGAVGAAADLYVNNAGVLFENFLFNGGSVGSISTSGVAVSYNTVSDYRVKRDLQPLEGSLEVLESLPIHSFLMEGSEERQEGVLAHELQAVVPSAVRGEKDGAALQEVDYSKLVPRIIAAIQELAMMVKR